MTSSPFIQELCSTKDSSSIYPMAYGYLTGWLDQECQRTNNGQVSRAEIQAKIAFINSAIALAFQTHEQRARIPAESL